jgi:hypothetical protein
LSRGSLILNSVWAQPAWPPTEGSSQGRTPMGETCVADPLTNSVSKCAAIARRWACPKSGWRRWRS